MNSLAQLIFIEILSFNLGKMKQPWNFGSVPLLCDSISNASTGH